MADLKLSQLTTQANIDIDNAYVLGVDVSDTSQAATGSNYRFKVKDLVDSVGGTTPDNFVWVSEAADFGTAVGGVITLAANTTYYITGTVDLNGDRLVGAENTTLLGATSEISRLTSTGLGASVALFSTQWTTPMRYFTIQDVGTAIDIDGTLRTVALDWDGVNFLNVTNVGVIDSVDNFIFDKGALLSSTGLTFTGTIGTIALNNSIFSGTGAANAIITLDAGLTVSRRCRITYSSFVVFGSTIGIDVDASATIPSEGFILDTLNFSAGGNYVNGIDYLDVRARWTENRGIQNTTSIGGFSMTQNPTITPIASSGVEYKVLGTTTPYASNQRFTHTNNRLTYIGSLTRFFNITASLSYRCPSRSNQQVGVYIAINGVPVEESEVYNRTINTTDLVSSTIVYVAELSTSDTVEIFIENFDEAQNLLVEYMNCVVQAIK